MPAEPPHEEGRVDDWLAEQGDLNWLDDPRDGEAAAAGQSHGALGQWPPAERPTRATRSPGVPSPAGPETIERRRRILALVTLALVVVAAVAVAIATSGGGGSGGSGGSPAAVGTTPPTSTLPATPPGPTTTPATGQSTTPAQTQPSLKMALPAGGKLSIGDTGPAVVALQKVLAALKLKVGTPDGDFGPRTQAAVIAYQTAHALNPDGIVGANTAQKLNQALASPGARG